MSSISTTETLPQHGSNPPGNFIPRDVEGLWSPGHVLAWHLEQAFRDDPAGWAWDRCLRWDRHEKTLPDVLDELEDCPCTLAQARADTGRFHVSHGAVVLTVVVVVTLVVMW